MKPIYLSPNLKCSTRPRRSLAAACRALARGRTSIAIARRLLAEAREWTGATHGIVKLEALAQHEIRASVMPEMALPAGAHWDHLSAPKPLDLIDSSLFEETGISFGRPCTRQE
jgi:hypothetical protein